MAPAASVRARRNDAVPVNQFKFLTDSSFTCSVDSACKTSKTKTTAAAAAAAPVWRAGMSFELRAPAARRRRRASGRFASVAVAAAPPAAPKQLAAAAVPMPKVDPKVDTKPATDVLAGALARAASQSTIHPLDTLKVRLQAGKRVSLAGAGGAGAAAAAGGVHAVAGAVSTVRNMYRGVLGAASGAGIAVGAYFLVYGAASNAIARFASDVPAGVRAFVAGGIAAAGSSVVKVPLAVCIRSVQAGVYPNAISAARSIIASAGPRGLFTGYLPTLMEDVPDMAVKFAVYETLQSSYRRCFGRGASSQEDFLMGAAAGAVAAAATTPFDVVKTRMMCTAASRPTMLRTLREIGAGGPRALFRGVGPRALASGVNSAVFFCFFEALRVAFVDMRVKQAAERAAAAKAGARGAAPRAAPLALEVAEA